MEISTSENSKLRRRKQAVLIPADVPDGGNLYYCEDTADWAWLDCSLDKDRCAYIDAGEDDLYPNQLVVLKPTRRKVRKNGKGDYLPGHCYWEVAKEDG